MVGQLWKQTQKGLEFSLGKRFDQEFLIVGKEEKGAGATSFTSSTRLENALAVEFGSQRGIQEVEIGELVQIVHEDVEAVKCYFNLRSYCKSLIFGI